MTAHLARGQPPSQPGSEAEVSLGIFSLILLAVWSCSASTARPAAGSSSPRCAR